jgi:hypothetical protein
LKRSPLALIPVWTTLALGLVAATACRRQPSGGEVHARLVVLQREVEGLRASTRKLERGDAILPETAVIVSVSDTLIQKFVEAQLPFEMDLESFEVSLSHVEATFEGSPTVRLRGVIRPKGHPELTGKVRAIGALTDVRVDATSGTLRARTSIDHIDLLEMAGLERFLSAGTVDELARLVRQQVQGSVPDVEIPVTIEQGIDLPSLTQGPVRVQGGTLPLQVAVADVFAGGRRLWVAIDVAPEPFRRAPPADDAVDVAGHVSPGPEGSR